MKDVKTTKYLIGIDEVGRGPIAGPVAVCSFLLKDEKILENQKEKNLPKLKDSKKLSKKQREIWFEYLKKQKEEGNCDYEVSFVSPENIDKFGIAKCIQKALNQSLDRVASQEMLFARSSDLLTENSFSEDGSSARPSQKASPALLSIFLDGGLHAPKEYINQETIIKGDELHPVISCASIMAKVSRDRVMTNYAKTYPEYGFEKHSGYGTKAHYEAIKKHGQIPIHRKTYIHFCSGPTATK
jgi:ribonuclease HII